MDYEIVHNCQVENLNQIYLDYFGYKTNGVFVEVGAYDGYNFSNTWGLAKAGWRGIYIEPVLEHVSKCRDNHSNHNVEVIPIAAGNETTTKLILVAGPLSTYDPTFVSTTVWRNYYANGKFERIIVDTLDNILMPKLIPEEFDLLVIDTEGSELKVLEGFNLNFWKPKMVIIEAQENNPYEELRVLAPEIDKYFSSYRKIYAGEVNSIYVSN